MRIIDDKPEIWPYILISLIIHSLVFFLIPKVVTTANFEEKPIEVFTVPAVPNEDRSANQIADIAEPAKQEKPKAPKFLGMYDSAVSQEMVGDARRPGKSGESKKAKDNSASEIIKREIARPKQEAKKDTGRDKLFAFNKSLFDDKREAPPEKKKGVSIGEGGSLDDFYPDFRRGPNTYLNVLRYPGVEYFVRMKHAFKVAFNPVPPIRDFFSRNLVSRGSIDVVLGVSVNRSGDLTELFVFRASGIPGYDQEAMRTVRASAPFATPPEKFLADDGLLRMTWTFSVYL